MKRALAAAAALASAVFAPAAHSQGYGELAFTTGQYEDSAAGDTIKASARGLRALLGYGVHEHLAIEGLAVFGLGDSDVKYNGETVPGVSLKLDNVIGLYLKPKIKPTNELELFARLGFARVKATLALDGYGSESGTENDFSWGVGASYAVAPNAFVAADYLSYLSKDGLKVNAFSIGVGYRF